MCLIFIFRRNILRFQNLVDCLDHEWYLLRFHAYKIGNKKILLGEARFFKMSEMCFWKGYHIILTMFYTYKAHENSSQSTYACGTAWLQAKSSPMNSGSHKI